MKKNIAVLFLWVSFFFSIPVFANPAQVGKPAPLFTATDIEGKEISLKDFSGKFVVLEWYSKICPCTNNHYISHHMQNLQKKYRDQGVVWITLSSHAPGTDGSLTVRAAKRRLLKRYKATPTAIVLDHDGRIGKTYGAISTPHVYVINPQGTLIYQGAIDNKIADGSSYNPHTSRNFLTEVLDAGLAGKTASIAETKSYGCAIQYAASTH